MSSVETEAPLSVNAVEACRLVVQTKSCRLIRHQGGKAARYDLKHWTEASEWEMYDEHGNLRDTGWVILDLFTASAIMAVYGKSSREVRGKMNLLGLSGLAPIVWKSVK